MLENRPQIAARRPDRVDRDDFSGTLKIDTIGTAQLNHSFSVAAAHVSSKSARTLSGVSKVAMRFSTGATAGSAWG